jgi:hypothetical protein
VHHAQSVVGPAQQWQQRWWRRPDAHGHAGTDLDPRADFDPRANLDAGTDHQRRADRNPRADEHPDFTAGRVLWRFRGQSPERRECNRRHWPVGRHRRNPYPDIG